MHVAVFSSKSERRKAREKNRLDPIVVGSEYSVPAGLK